MQGVERPVAAEQGDIYLAVAEQGAVERLAVAEQGAVERLVAAKQVVEGMMQLPSQPPLPTVDLECVILTRGR